MRDIGYFKDTAPKNHSVLLTPYVESRAIKDVKHGHVSPYGNTFVIQTASDSHF